MIGKTEVSKALDGAFRAALMLTGSMQAAEHAVFNGIAATDCSSAEDDALLLETASRFSSSIAGATCAPPFGASATVSTHTDLSRLFRIANSPRIRSGDLLKDFASRG
jgi:hypothetical protein